MMKFANVIYNYIPKNDDELELKEGDEIEVLGVEEEGWWRGKLRGKIGVFPSNFVKVAEVASSPASQSVLSANQSNSLSTIQSNKLNLFGKNSKTSLSSNSLNSNNSNSNSSNNVNNNNNYHNNQIMNNTPQQQQQQQQHHHQQQQQQQQQQGALVASSIGGEDPSASERRPKPIRGIGYGDIFAAGAKPKPSLGSDTASSDRLSSNFASTLQKQIPKKPPPPAPSNSTDDHSGGSADQAPALPPKPANQFSPHMHHSKLYPPPPSSTVQKPPPRREQARVIYAYERSHDDELALEVGDIIDIIDKEIEDQGWWKGELRGEIGVFPDNFVQLIEVPEPVDSAPGVPNAQSTTSPPQDWSPRSANRPTTVPNIEGKIKSVFDNAPKGFGKDLENSLVKHNGSASFLSLKRNKLQQMATSESMADENGKKEDSPGGSLLSNTPKLNHITANRAKGPSRRPPTNIMNKRGPMEPGKAELNGNDETPLASLPVRATSPPVATHHDILSSLPAGQNNNSNTNNTSAANGIIGALSSTKSPPDSIPYPSTVNQAQSIDTVPDNHVITPKTSQRLTQPPNNIQDKNKPTTPPWMLELKKAHAEKRRDTVPSTPIQATTNELANDTKPATVDPPAPAPAPSTTHAVSEAPINEKRPSVQSVRGSYETPAPTTTPSAVKNLSSRYSTEFNPVQPQNDSASNKSSAQDDSLVKQISSNLQSEIGQLRDEVKLLRDEFQDLKELKSVIEVMKIELKACQSATESQKRWMKDLVDNLADERKKIAAMQTEIDRNLK